MFARAVSIFLLVLCLTLILSQSVEAEVPLIVFDIGDTAVPLGGEAQPLEVYLTNFQDTVAGFQFVARSSRPDLIWFDFENGGVDISGTITSGWQYIEVQNIDGDGSALWFRGMANTTSLPYVHGVPPQQGAVAVKLLLKATSTPPGLGEDRHTEITVANPFDFSDPTGNGIGVITDTIVDTFYYRCVIPSPEECLEWEQVEPGMPYDTIYVDSSLYGYLDTTRVIHYDGAASLATALLCDTNNDLIVDIGDLTDVISCLFINPGVCATLGDCDTNGDQILDIGDVTDLIIYLFL